MNVDVQVAFTPSRPLAVVRRVIGRERLAQTIAEGCSKVARFLADHEVLNTGTNVVVYRHVHSDIFELDCGVQVVQAFTPDETVLPSGTPAGLTARAVHLGAYEQLAEVHTALRRWCQQNRRQLVGPSWEVYVSVDPAQPRTEIFYLLDDDSTVA